MMENKDVFSKDKRLPLGQESSRKNIEDVLWVLNLELLVRCGPACRCGVAGARPSRPLCRPESGERGPETGGSDGNVTGLPSFRGAGDHLTMPL